MPSKGAMHKYGGFKKYVIKCLKQLLSPQNILLDLWSEFSFDSRYKVSTSMIIYPEQLCYNDGDKEAQKQAVMHRASAPYRVIRALKVLKKYVHDLLHDKIYILQNVESSPFCRILF